jgi:histidinol-phosphate/aromatic aminotransferase/cobyric acid decarboxylase-like protein/N-acyl-L-homoserine lactone synthetase
LAWLRGKKAPADSTTREDPVADAMTVLTLADARDREEIYRIRHEVYATELGQHPENAAGRLTDSLDAVNTYLVARRAGVLLGFVAVTPPNETGYSLDKYFSRADVPVAFDDGLYEVRLLTVVHLARRSQLAFLLMYGALRFCESRGARTIAAIGRLEVLDVYRRAGLQSLGRRVRAGAVTYELLAARVVDLQHRLLAFDRFMRRTERDVDWQVQGVERRSSDACYHGGAFFEAIGDEFDTLEQAQCIISADVLDAWFPPAPSVLTSLATHLSFALRTSPPIGCEGLQRVVARSRGVGVENILPGAGSSDLIFAALKQWASRDSRVLILDPMYGEYAHLLEKVIGARVDRLTLSRESSYDVSADQLQAAIAQGYDWVVLVNPNSPTGRYVPGGVLEQLVSSAPAATRIWVDETYVDFAGGDSLERYAARSSNVVVCKSMSKAYALSGVRAAYLCGPLSMMRELRVSCPPWSVSLPGQVAACEALRATDYYRDRWRETHVLRHELADVLTALGWDVVPGCANFLLCHLPEDGPDAATVAAQARLHGLFVRDVGNMGTGLGAHALRVAVKDRVTNGQIQVVLKTVRGELAGPRGRRPNAGRAGTPRTSVTPSTPRPAWQ